ncbi:carboxylesterase/lipase family protein [Clostridiales bacterium]|nr:carboxylesterase/lipase family protein [Clostridiales bacterium]
MHETGGKNMRKQSKRKLTGIAVLLLSVIMMVGLSSCGEKAKEETEPANVATTPYGQYEGKAKENGVLSFLGVPYAKQPVGDLRWKEAEPLEKSDELLKCHEYGNTPIQVSDEFEQASTTKQGEDCLTANIWTRDISGKKPTMVYIYGGGYVSGGTADPLYHGENFVENNDVVMVSINYRLGPFGFLDLSKIGGTEYEHSRNLGLLDQIAGLKWVKENISSFGGDPDNVTVFGESAGASSIMRLMSSDLSNGLFQKAIIESGGNASIKHVGDKKVDRIKQSQYVAEKFLETTGKKDLQGLLELSGEEVQSYADQLADQLGDDLDLTTWGCVPDGYAVPYDVYGNISKGSGKDVSILIGTNADEINYFNLYDPDLEKSLEEEYQEGTTLGRDFSKNKKCADSYIEAKKDDPQKYTDFCSEYEIRQPSLIFAEMQSAYNDVYMYQWAWKSQIEGLGAAHAVELPFVFGTFDSVTAKRTAGDQLPRELSLKVQAAWAAFAAKGDPTIEGEAEWPKFDQKNRDTMVIDDSLWKVVNDPMPEGRNYLRPMFDVKIPEAK